MAEDGTKHHTKVLQLKFNEKIKTKKTSILCSTQAYLDICCSFYLDNFYFTF